MLRISNQVCIDDDEIEITAVRAQGAGGQNVNKVATAIHLRFDIRASSLPDSYKHRLLRLNDKRINKEGVLVIKAQRYRSQEKNRLEALERLRMLLQSASFTKKKRIPTNVSKAVKKRRLDEKTRRAKIKGLRKKVTDD